MNSALFAKGSSICWMSVALLAGMCVTSCGGGGGSRSDSGTQQTYLSVQAADAEGDSLTYQWRATSGTIENRNSAQTVWKLPDGPGLHFAYVMVSDGKGGYVEQQYAVSTDALKTTAPTPQAVDYVSPAVAGADEYSGGSVRLRLYSADSTAFVPASGSGAAALRRVYLPDVQVRVVNQGTGARVFAGTTDVGGEVSLPQALPDGTYQVTCTTADGVALSGCSTITLSGQPDTEALAVSPASGAARNLRLFGHIALADGGVCGTQDEFFGALSAATVQLLDANGAALSTRVHVNRFGDYALDAAVGVHAALKLKVQCEAYTTILSVPVPAAGFASTTPVELSYALPNSRPSIVKVVANGPDGNVRGQMVVPIPGSYSTKNLPGALDFLTYKGNDTRLSACLYYRSLGATRDCDAQGNMITPISFDDWKRKFHFQPYSGANTEVSATYVNRMDLNLVRRMVATKVDANTIAFYVCNSPGPQGTSQDEADEVIDTAVRGEKVVACVAMEYSASSGRSGGNPFTKFLTFGPDGALLPSVNLDGRGEKYMPGACVACHGGTSYTGRFAQQGRPTPDLKAHFLPFDTGNYIFSTRPELSEAAQTDAIHALNALVVQTQATPSTQNLIAGWYSGANPSVLDKAYVPPAWSSYDATHPGAAQLYREVVGRTCRTCHAAMVNFNWDGGTDPAHPEVGPPKLIGYSGSSHICGGGPDLYANASMPNALISRDRMQARLDGDPVLASLMQQLLGCSTPQADPAYPRR